MSDVVPPDSPSAGPVSTSLTALVPRPGGGGVGVNEDGELLEWEPQEAVHLLQSSPVLLCHRRFTARRAAGSETRNGGTRGKRLHAGHFDILELFAFVRPAHFCVPTPRGVARALGLTEPTDPEGAALTLHLAVRALLHALEDPAYPDREESVAIAKAMKESGWPWGPAVLDALLSQGSTSAAAQRARIDIWAKLPEWEDQPPPPPPGAFPVLPDDARTRLSMLTGSGAEERQQQRDYAATVTKAFRPREAAGAPQILLAEAGTGTGKTLGYIAPASLWAEQNEGTVWLSTYTKNLQRQLDQELTRLYPDPIEKDQKSVIRKGRENYLCLLNLEEQAGGLLVGPQGAAAALIARWARYSRDGDMVGGDFPAWLPGGMGADAIAANLTDRRGECSYSACTHYKKCFIEKTVRKARSARIVVANHALVMIQAALDHTLAQTVSQTENRAGRATVSPGTAHDTAGGAEDDEPTNVNYRRHIVFDEGHHLFDAADSAFSSFLSGREMTELRRWTRGNEEGRRRRSRGLQDRVSDLVAGDSEGESLLDIATRAAAQLPGPGWLQRVQGEAANGPAEGFLHIARAQVLARSDNPDTPYSLECELRPLEDELSDAAAQLDQALSGLERAFRALADCLRRLLDEQNETLDGSTRTRMDAAIRGLDRRGRATLPAWRQMLADLMKEPHDTFVDWLSIERIDGSDFDVGLHRHWIDPSKPFAEAVLQPLHGGLITSATLRDRGGDADIDLTDTTSSWESAEVRTGIVHLPTPVERAHFSSPFDYGQQARIFVVQDVSRDRPDQVASAYRDLFLASGGGGLGLFTAVNRLRAVYERIVEPLETGGYPLYAQHVDAIDTGTLVDIFRAEEASCLLGTDAVRDGVDVPGRSLRLIVLDRTPWPRPDILYKARRAAFGGGRYTDMITRLRLQQAFGRLVRASTDKGVFVLLDNRLPTRLTRAFPPEVEVQRVSLKEAIDETRLFLSP
ncbi:MAG: ATP-dependent DNA helicase [Alphaproteobacteria bacterium]|nr:ATP-dependent DNA helicase [Alphaproteobacteria bacterium]MBO6628747.1 ATP-dependent DNA helicase [Alphaproteobacteria bacterium]MDF1627371.1 ATP-dependent DNA helicase [Parvibaculaceae bacterium]